MLLLEETILMVTDLVKVINTSGAGTVHIDALHPYFLQSSNHPGMVLVNQSLIETNYSRAKAKAKARFC